MFCLPMCAHRLSDFAFQAQVKEETRYEQNILQNLFVSHTHTYTHTHTQTLETKDEPSQK